MCVCVKILLSKKRQWVHALCLLWVLLYSICVVIVQSYCCMRRIRDTNCHVHSIISIQERSWHSAVSEAATHTGWAMTTMTFCHFCLLWRCSELSVSHCEICSCKIYSLRVYVSMREYCYIYILNFKILTKNARFTFSHQYRAVHCEHRLTEWRSSLWKHGMWSKNRLRR